MSLSLIHVLNNSAWTGAPLWHVSSREAVANCHCAKLSRLNSGCPIRPRGLGELLAGGAGAFVD